MPKFNQLTNAEKETLIEKLNEAPNMEHFLLILLTNFNLRECSPGIITKKILSNNMVKVVLPMLNPDKL